MLVDEAVHIHWPSEFRNKDQVDCFWPFFRIDNRMCRLEFPQLLQSRENPVLQSDQSSTAGPLRLPILPLAGGAFPKSPLNAGGSALPVDVLPLEADAFAWPHAGRDRNGEKSSVGEEKIRFDTFSEETGLFIDSFYAFASTELASKLHRGNGCRVRFNDNANYPQILEIVSDVPLPKNEKTR